MVSAMLRIFPQMDRSAAADVVKASEIQDRCGCRCPKNPEKAGFVFPVLVWPRGTSARADHSALEAVTTRRPIICLYVLDVTPVLQPLGAAALWGLASIVDHRVARGRALEAFATMTALWRAVIPGSRHTRGYARLRRAIGR